jgi:hypothetical protein
MRGQKFRQSICHIEIYRGMDVGLDYASIVRLERKVLWVALSGV